jgi:hypothetical protein
MRWHSNLRLRARASEMADAIGFKRNAVSSHVGGIMELDNLGSADSVTITATRFPEDKFSVKSGTSQIDTVILADQVLELRMRNRQCPCAKSARQPTLTRVWKISAAPRRNTFHRRRRGLSPMTSENETPFHDGDENETPFRVTSTKRVAAFRRRRRGV